jgi:hypothetical protein
MIVMPRRRPLFLAGFALVAIVGCGAIVFAESDADKAANKDKPAPAAESAEQQPRESIYVRAARAARAQSKSTGDVTVYTNALLAERFADAEAPTPAEGFTTEDLVSRFGEPSPGAPEASAPASPAGGTEKPLAWLEQQEQERNIRAARVSEAEAELAAAQEKLENLKVQLLAARNPFSARPQLSDEEKELRKDSGESASERYERTELLVEEAEAEVAAARQKLSRAKSGR